MIVPKQKIESAVSTDPIRASLGHVLLDGDRLIACDGRIMAVVPVVRESEDKDGMISRHAIEYGRKADRATIKVGKKYSTAKRKGVVIAFPVTSGDLQYPEYNAVLKQNDGKTPVFKISFDADLLAKLADALLVRGRRGSSGLTLEFFGTTDPIRVKPNQQGNGAVGMLMPMCDFAQ